MTKLLVVDAETTSLDTATLTVLEFAWTITEPDGTQLIPIRQRYTALSAGESLVYPLLAPKMGGVAKRWTDHSTWHQRALEMAEESGLREDWLACPGAQIIRHTVELERLLLDDIAKTCDPGELNPRYDQFRLTSEPVERWLRPPERLHVHGMGVAQFDQPLMRLLFPRVVGGPHQAGVTHYRPVDTSGNQTGLLGGCEDDKLIAWGLETYGAELGTIEVGRPPQSAYLNPDVASRLTKGRVHRAAADVVRAVVLQRILWRYAQPLREALGLEPVESDG